MPASRPANSSSGSATGRFWRLVSRPRLRPIILESSLPVELLRIVQRVTAGTRLWKTEQDDVARELCDHFADGLTAGRSPQ